MILLSQYWVVAESPISGVQLPVSAGNGLNEAAARREEAATAASEVFGGVIGVSEICVRRHVKPRKALRANCRPALLHTRGMREADHVHMCLGDSSFILSLLPSRRGRGDVRYTVAQLRLGMVYALGPSVYTRRILKAAHRENTEAI